MPTLCQLYISWHSWPTHREKVACPPFYLSLLRIFKSLEEKGLIKKEGKGKNIYYMLV